MLDSMLTLHGPALARFPVVLDSPHSGRHLPADFKAIVDETSLRDGEDCYVDALWAPAAERGVPLLAAGIARTYLDVNRHAGDIDLDLLEGAALPADWPGAWQPSGKARIGKALVWRSLDDGRPIYNRSLSPAELLARIARCHTPYHDTLRGLLDAAHQAHGQVFHINCHSMNPVAGVNGEGGAGQSRADIVLGDRDGSTCAPEWTEWIRDTLTGLGYSVAVNDPYKGVELVRAYANPAQGRHSLQLELNKRLYMDMGTLQRTAGFEVLQGDLMRLLDGLCARLGARRP